MVHFHFRYAITILRIFHKYFKYLTSYMYKVIVLIPAYIEQRAFIVNSPSGQPQKFQFRRS